MVNVLSYADGSNDLIELSENIRLPFTQTLTIADVLHREGLLERVME
jgi:aminopeptidase-like protein